MIPPLSPVLLAPDSAAGNVAIAPVIKWAGSAGAQSYRIQVSLSPVFSSIVKDTAGYADTSLVLSGLSNNTQYYWHVDGSNSGGAGAWSPTWSFKTIISVPSAVILLAPAGDTLKQDSILCLWNSSSPNVNKYDIEVYSDSTFSTLFMADSSIADTTFMLKNLHDNTTYWVRMRASNIAGWAHSRPRNELLSEFLLQFLCPNHAGNLPASRCAKGLLIMELRPNVLLHLMSLISKDAHYSAMLQHNRIRAPIPSISMRNILHPGSIMCVLLQVTTSVLSSLLFNKVSSDSFI